MRRLKDDVAQGQLVNRLVHAHHLRHLVYSDDSKEEEDFLVADHKPVKDGGRHGRDYEMDTGEFKLKVDIPFFYW